jgi:hypothetical protein
LQRNAAVFIQVTGQVRVEPDGDEQAGGGVCIAGDLAAVVDCPGVVQVIQPELAAWIE